MTCGGDRSSLMSLESQSRGVRSSRERWPKPLHILPRTVALVGTGERGG